MCARYDGTAKGVETAIGLVPADGELDISGLKIDADTMKELLRVLKLHRISGITGVILTAICILCRRFCQVDKDAWRKEIPDLEKHFNQFGDRLPPRIKAQVEQFKKRME